MYQHGDQGFSLGGGSAAVALAPDFGRRGLAGGRFADLDLVVDLGARIGSKEWWRGLGTLAALCAAALTLSPGLNRPLPGAVPAASTADQWDQVRAQSISPLAYGADSGRHMAATDLVRPLAEAPERPMLELTAAIGEGDSFARVLERAGVADAEAEQVADMIASATPLDDIAAGTRLDIRLGRRANKHIARPLDALALRARFDLRLELKRVGGVLQLTRVPIRVDYTPLRVTGEVGDSLYRAARAAGAPARAVETYLRAIGSKMSVGGIGSDAHFDLIVEQRRAETGEVETGKLLYAGLTQGRRKLQLLEWTADGRTEWFDAAGVGEKRAGLTRPVTGHLTSSFGMRFHPLLGYSRLHKGMDIGAPTGTPIYAVTDGVVTFAGRHGGHGNFVQLKHGGNMGTGYAHMSRIAVRPGQHVRQGQVIGYVGSTGLSTGPHLHFEVYRGGQAINPKSVSFVSTSLLSGQELRAFRSKLAGLLATPVS
ncbi:peptidase M23 family protein [Sphingomonas changbaiensis NBRC 104936]|uniref:Peptidase M23 family protein n=1 Tax=Sphingomonas changbaiensis NBRC 104936 TaxID=1219043 RepID=A0A0E9MS20_9SPHN|nr:M23 family metallopeptidase [Sphingomonas changbaiensis]GAO39915.1 peptidase M23 family protein [Sphingomonas changbaiensis NBRC 104936]